MNLIEMLRDTDALTYINSLKVTLTEIKNEVSEQDKMREHMNESSEKVRKLVRKADNQYRLIAKIAQGHGSVAGELTIQNDLQEVDEDLKNLMEAD